MLARSEFIITEASILPACFIALQDFSLTCHTQTHNVNICRAASMEEESWAGGGGNIEM